MQAATEIILTAEQLFSEMTDWHARLKENLRQLRAKRRKVRLSLEIDLDT